MENSFTITLDGIPIEVRKKKIKTVRLAVLPPDGSVRLSVPLRATDEYIVAFLEEKKGWIKKQRDKFQGQSVLVPLEYVSGEEIPVFGEYCTLHVVYDTGRSSLVQNGSELILTVREDSTPEERASVVAEWYRGILRDRISQLLPQWEQITGLFCGSWQIRSMKTRWGSCNTVTRKVWLNLELAKKPVECLEYVILHELVHLRVPNHGKDFYAVLDSCMPDWKTRRNLLNNRRSD